MKSNKTKLHFQRFEYKYQLPENLVEGLIPEFLKHMEFDPYAVNLSNNGYKVSSLYYDSAGLDCYHQKVAGVRTRKKLRIRFYEPELQPETPVFLELKKKYDNVVVKDRIKMPYLDCYQLLASGLSLKPDLTSQRDQEFLDNFLWIMIYNGMQPQNMVVYQRQPFISQTDSQFRVTIDSDLRTYSSPWLSSERPGEPVSPGLVVLEVKFNNMLPFWFHQIIQRNNLEQRPFSKYCQSLELCSPNLAAPSRAEAY